MIILFIGSPVFHTFSRAFKRLSALNGLDNRPGENHRGRYPQLLLMLLASSNSKASLYCTNSLPESQGIFAEICRTNAEKPKFSLFDAKKAA
jgi:hypothetical protein